MLHITCYKFDVNDIRIPGWSYGLVKMDSAMIFPMEDVSYARTADTDTLVWDSDNPPVNILFSIFVTYAPVFITLTSASYFPVINWALLGTVSYVTAACFDGRSAHFGSTVKKSSRQYMGRRPIMNGIIVRNKEKIIILKNGNDTYAV